MHPRIATMVSSLFYDGSVVTPADVSVLRSKQESPPLLWCDLKGDERFISRSRCNDVEVSACVRTCARLREKHGMGVSTAILSFYRGQIDALLRSTPCDLKAEVLTVDACQGSEFDYVILSTVPSNASKVLTFVNDVQRM